MRFGFDLFGIHPKNRASDANFYEVIELTRKARDCGFHMVFAGHHYLVEDFQKFQPIPALSRVAAESGDMFLCVTELVPLSHPIQIAEYLSTMEAITGGRIVLCAALGYSEKEFKNFGIDRSSRRKRFTEALQVIKKLWTEDSVTYDGDHFSLENASINPKPIQDPRPPIWVTADAAPGVKRAARTGDAWLISSHGKIDHVKEQLRIYDEASIDQPTELPDFPMQRPMMRTGYIAEDRTRALEAARSSIEDMWRVYYAAMGQEKEMDDPEDFTQEYESLVEDRFVLGDPDDWVRHIKRYRDELGIDLIDIDIAGTHAEKLAGMELISRYVMPAFQ